MNSTDHHQKLAILTPRWGLPSETFVRRHVTSILPGRTIAIAQRIRNADWCPEVPLLSVPRNHRFTIDRLARAFGQWRYDRNSRALRNFLAEHQATAVMGEWLDFSAMWFPNVSDLGLRFFAHAHGADVTRKALKRPWHRILYRRLAEMHGVITVSQLTKQRLLDSFNLNPDSVHVIPCGVELPSVIVPRAESENVICLHVGRMVEKKGPLITLKAFHRAWRECARLRLELIGDGPLLERCRSYAGEHGISGVVTFHGSRPHDYVKERLARADLLLLHSVTADNGDEEGLPVAILEGMAYGLPVVSTRHAGIPEAVLDGQTGLLVVEHDEAAMSQYILELAKQPELRRQMGETGRNRAREMFSAEQEIQRLRELVLAG